ncbi:Fic/DOC family N-terminal domain-containing protein [Chitinophaga parva]|uniref:Fic/DOC family N-terminal domain-containing protein n=1 Tax=Chitinophaga parva TaxID=2169414 RepID=UPI00196B0A0A|nr:Fic/DOC family N-terminal domain-containing protein [Chitinophaga parva]
MAHKALAELKGGISSLPNENIILETLTLQEAKDSSAIENIIATFDEIYQSDVQQAAFITPAAKEGVLLVGNIRDLMLRYNLEQLVDDKILGKVKVGRDNFYLNTALFKLLTQ